MMPSWITAFRVALLGTFVALLLLIWPVSVRAPGDHENMTCSRENRLPPRQNSSPEYWGLAAERCNDARTSRTMLAVGAIAITVLAATYVGTRDRDSAI